MLRLQACDCGEHFGIDSRYVGESTCVSEMQRCQEALLREALYCLDDRNEAIEGIELCLVSLLHCVFPKVGCKGTKKIWIEQMF